MKEKLFRTELKNNPKDVKYILERIYPSSIQQKEIIKYFKKNGGLNENQFDIIYNEYKNQCL